MLKGVAVTLTITLFTAGAYAGRQRDVPIAPPPDAPALHSTAQSDAGPGAQSEAAQREMSSSPLQFDEPAPVQRRDVYGNDITDAVATYKRDASGGVYEEHSPHTEVPQLKPPTS